MIKIDLITGFLGAGKTTFLRRYAEHLLSDGQRIGIIENDFGAVNVDRMLLQGLESDRCMVEQIVGGNVVSDWKRRFRTKLIAFSMQGLDRVLVEPSGIYDIDTFFDVLYDDPICSLYEVGSILAIVDAGQDTRLSEQAEYLLMSQAACSGQIILSRLPDAPAARAAQTEQITAYLSALLKKYGCTRDIRNCVLARPWGALTAEDFQRLMSCGRAQVSHRELHFAQNEVFAPLFFMNPGLREAAVRPCVEALFQNAAFGTVFRVKGFFRYDTGGWAEINATAAHYAQNPIPDGQDVIIVIGEKLDKAAITAHFARCAHPAQ